ncbi:hypothetical protein BX600DRAFT_451876 [Xylariales sp. PMI_506]|nr:hypothetical protein BX600DRAFT_451876 [Xylariales sp. PMI_506]
MGYVVHDKMSLLEGDDNNNNNDYNNKNNNGGSGSSNSLNATLLDGMNFDHQGGVEYEIMVQASYFLGISTSTMSLMAAYARTVDAELVNGLDYWQGLIYPGTELTQGKWSMNRNYQYDNHKIRGDGTTNLMVVSGPDMMEYFP